MQAMMSKDEFFAALEGGRKPQHGGGHPFSAAWANGELTRAQLGQWAIQHFYYIDAVPQQFAALFARMPDLDARHHLLENLLGEEMPGKPGKRHPDLLVKFAGACGISRDAMLGAEAADLILPTTRAMRSWVWELSSVRHLAEAAGGIMVALEGQLPMLYPKYVAAMNRMGFKEDDLEFFHVHIEGDTEHARFGLEITNRYATTPDLQRAAIAAVRSSAAMRWSMLDGIQAAIQTRNAA